MALYIFTVLKKILNFRFRYTRLLSACCCSSGTHCSSKNIPTKTLHPTSASSTSIPADQLPFPAHAHPLPTSIISIGKPATVNLSHSRPATADSYSNRQWIPTTRTHSKWLLSVQALRRCLSITTCVIRPAELIVNECAMNWKHMKGAWEKILSP